MRPELLAEYKNHAPHVGIGPLGVLPTTQEKCVICNLLTALREAQKEIAWTKVELQATASVLESWFPGRAPTAPHDLAFLLGQQLDEAQAETEGLKTELTPYRTWDDDGEACTLIAHVTLRQQLAERELSP